ncbi:MFS general substrate transporter [Calocera viscosa TUFC12733]|uniref:MFS general substrate transporter n=1 Tax=Calocera viscosa (strain TUFC12733) TaxID=1330018 RepID=A0A167KRG0_CALVF|nr:MFS general substrate transporter [Calocera viscosa TUFC12733]
MAASKSQEVDEPTSAYVIADGFAGAPELPVLEGDLPPNSTWKRHLWSSLDVDKDEARFLTKLDLCLISSAALGVMIRYLDQVNITNAFNSGMKEDLGLYGNELNYANAFWSAAYVIGQVPSNLILTRVSAPYYIAFLEFAWTIFTIATSGVKNTSQLYAIRFFVGLFEAGHFPAVMYVASSYYKPHELARRNTIIQVFTAVGPLFSGFLMAAVYASLNGRGNWPGWRWLYVICGLISFPCACWTIFAMPELPARIKPNWLYSAKDIEIAKRRMPGETKLFTGLFKWKDVLRWHQTWHVWLFPLFFLCNSQLSQPGGSMIFWVKSYNTATQTVFSVAAINIIPLGINFIQIAGALASSWVSDALPGSQRWPSMVFAAVMGIIFSIALGATPVHPPDRSSRWALYYLTALAGTSAGVTWTYVNETSRHDPEKRAYVSAMMNAFAYIFSAWVPIFTFPTQDQPYVTMGNYVTAGFGAVQLLVAFLIGYLDHLDRKRAKANFEIQKKQQADAESNRSDEKEINEKEASE